MYESKNTRTITDNKKLIIFVFVDFSSRVRRFCELGIFFIRVHLKALPKIRHKMATLKRLTHLHKEVKRNVCYNLYTSNAIFQHKVNYCFNNY